MMLVSIMRKFLPFVFILIFFAIQCKETAETSRAAVATFVKGIVKASGKTERKLTSGDFIYETDVIETGPKARIHLYLNTSTVVNIGPDSKVEIEQINRAMSGRLQTSIRLRRGQIFSKLKKLKKDQAFQVKTQTFTAGVRGTEFLSETSEDDSAKVAVNEGSVQVANEAGESVTVDEGKKAVVSKDGELQEADLSEDEVSQLNDLSKVTELKEQNKQMIEDLLEKQKLLKKKASNIEGVKKQVEKNKDLIKKQKEKNKESLKKFKKDQQSEFEKRKEKILEKKNDPRTKALEKIRQLKEKKNKD